MLFRSLTIFSPITVILQVLHVAIPFYCDELSIFGSCHLVSLDSAGMTRSNETKGAPIPSIISTFRPQSYHHNNSARVLSSVPLSFPIETLITKRKPSDDGPYGQCLRNAGVRPGFGNYCHARVSHAGHSPGIPIPGLTNSYKCALNNLIPIKREPNTKTKQSTVAYHHTTTKHIHSQHQVVEWGEI